MQAKPWHPDQGVNILHSPLFLPVFISLCIFPWIAQDTRIAVPALLIIAVAVIICLRPTIGIHLISALLPMHAIKIAINSIWTTPSVAGANIGSLANPQELTFALGQFEYWVFFPFQLMGYLIIPALLFCQHRWQKTIAPNHSFITRRADRWMIYLPIGFMVWSLFSLLWIPAPIISSYSLLRFASNFLIIFFIINVLKRYDMIIHALSLYFIFAVIHTGFAVVSTWYPFFYSQILAQGDFNVVHLLVSLSNSGTSYNFERIGMADGYGWAAKHELGMYTVTAILISPILYRYYRSFTVRLFIISSVLPLAMLLHRGPIKVSILGSFLVVSAFAILLPKLRNMFMVIMIIMITLNVVGVIGGQFERVPIKNKMGMTTGNIENAASKSEYEAGTMSYRIGLWKKTVQRIVKSKGMGAGGDSLMRDKTFMGIHSCSLPLNLINDFGFIGFACIILFIFIPVMFTWQRIIQPRDKIDELCWLQIALLASLFTCLLDHAIDLFYWNHQIYFLTGLLWAVLRLDPASVQPPASPKRLATTPGN